MAAQTRPYKVLEERELADLVTQLLGDDGLDLTDEQRVALLRYGPTYRTVLDVAAARNSDHAMRQAKPFLEAGEREVIAVSGANWKSKTWQVRSKTTMREA